MANSLFELVKRVQGELPEGCEITICLDHGDSRVVLNTPEAETTYRGDLEDCIHNALFDALEEVTSK